MGSEHPTGGVNYPRTYQEFREWFPDDAACLDYLGRLRWPHGFVCPACGKDRYWPTGKALFMCADCGRKTSVTAGTIFHRSHTPLSTWFAAIWFVTSQKNGVSALGLQRALGFGSYETAWAWMQKLGRAMVRPDRDLLSGVVELDQIYVGGRSAGKKAVPPTRWSSPSPSNATGGSAWAGSGSTFPNARTATSNSTSRGR